MLVEFKLSGELLLFNYQNPILKYYNSEKNNIVDNYSFKENIDFHNCIFDISFFHIVNESIEQIIVPCSPRFELYYLCQNDQYYFFDNYFEAIKILENPKIDNDEVNSFHSKMTCKSGNTFHSEIKRLIPGRKYFLNNNILVYEDYMPIDGLNLNYTDFKTRFEACVKNITEGKDVALLLSGGVDSTAIGLAASKFSKSLRTYTMRYIPLQSGIEADAIIAKKTSDDNNWIHKVIDIEFTGNLKKLINLYSSEIPLVCGLPHGYNGLLETMKSDNIEIALTGQNADLLTYFGATAKFKLNREGIVAFIRRLFLSKYYCRFLDRRESYLNKISSVFIYLFGYFVSVFYSLYKKEQFRQPKNISELFQYSIENPDSIPFVKKNNLKTDHDKSYLSVPSVLNADNFHFYLLRHRLGSDMMLSDSQLIKVAGKLNNVLVDFPFSTNSLVYFFMNRELGLKSLFDAKNFIDRYVQENYPKYSKKINIIKKEKSFEPHEWAEKILTNGNIPLNNDGIIRTKFGELYFNVSKLWSKNVHFLFKQKK